jgi:hypothetical protein
MPAPSPLLHATNTLMAPFDRRRDPAAVWARLQRDCEKEFGFAPTGPEADALKELLHQFAKEPGLSPMGRYSVAQVHVGPRLRNVARVNHALTVNDNIAQEPVDDPIFVVGLPRTATTVTHQFLSQAQGHRGPLMAEMYATRDHYPNWKSDLARAHRQVAQLYRYMPSFRDIHPLYADAPEETFFAEVASHYFLCSAPLPGYRRWLDAQDPVPWYQWLKKVLQVLQHGKPRTRWVLKQPDHMRRLDALFTVFPRATVVWMHREPETVFGSACSMIEGMRRLHQKPTHIDPKAIGDQWLDLLAEAVEAGRDARPRVPTGAIIDVPYHRLTTDPASTVPDLYDRLGIAWTDRDTEQLSRYFRRRHTDRRHEYTTHYYGKDADEVRARFGDYPDLVARLNARPLA